MRNPQQALTANELDRILDRRSGFSFHFQPIVDLRHGLTVGFEALARFTVGNQRIPPNLVFDAATTFGRRLDLEQMVLRDAFAARLHLPPNCFLTVNVGPSFLLSERFDRLIAEVPTLAGVIVEITEDEIVHDYATVKRKLELIRSKGGLAAVDDAGSGYASLHHIMEIRPNVIKLDRSFIRHCDSDPAKGVFIEMLVKAANRLDAWIVAEGLETSEELDELIRLDVPLGQGFYLARPEPCMRMLPEEKSQAILDRAASMAIRSGIERCVESAFVCHDILAAEKWLRGLPVRSVAVIVASSGRPATTVENHPILGIRTLPEFMSVQRQSESCEVLQRALARPPHTRFDPLLVIDDSGRMEGVIHLDRLMRENLAL